jgi:ribosomal protein S12 methylthiotransferase
MQYPDDVEDGLKQDRLAEIMELQRAISAERLERFVGREVDVLMEDRHVGRVKWQADDVDGVTYVDGAAAPRDFVRARITASEDYDFQAAALT